VVLKKVFEDFKSVAEDLIKMMDFLKRGELP
jgi:hypothetical protein